MNYRQGVFLFTITNDLYSSSFGLGCWIASNWGTSLFSKSCFKAGCLDTRTKRAPMSSRRLVRKSSISSEARSFKSSHTEFVISPTAVISVSFWEIHSRSWKVSISAPLNRSCSIFCTALNRERISFANIRYLSASTSPDCSYLRQRLRMVLKESAATWTQVKIKGPALLRYWVSWRSCVAATWLMLPDWLVAKSSCTRR